MSEMSVKDAKEKAKKRDGYECCFCGVTREQHKQEYGRDLHAHHIVKRNSEGADLPKNLITVCRDCHDTLESTQANALERIRHEHVAKETEKLRQKIGELENKIDSLTEENETLRKHLQNERKKTEERNVIVLSENIRKDVIVLVKGKVNPTVQIYHDETDAIDDFRDFDGVARMRRKEIRFKEPVVDEVKALSDGPINLMTADRNQDKYVENGELHAPKRSLSRVEIEKILEEDEERQLEQLQGR